jgi:prolyl-tRNA editing enzyme YbaK/EbsC (Cys-tRNA(Pro) deacylase)
MLICHEDPTYSLVELADLELEPPPDWILPHLAPLRAVVAWAEEYLCRPHPELGREGPVCPFVQAAMRKGLFLLSVCPGRDLDQSAIQRRILGFRDRFLALAPREGSEAAFKTVLILFPDLDAEDLTRLIESTQEGLKPGYVEKGLMIGEFHPGPPRKAGLWNPDFRPLKSPVPMLVIRHMVPTDFAFLRDERRLVETYLERYGQAVPAHLRTQVQQAAARFGIPFGRLEDMEVVHPRVRAVLERCRVPVVVRRHADQPIPIDGPHDFARALGYDIGRITKSLFVRCHCHGRYAVVVCPVHRRVDLPAIAGQLGCTRLELASHSELEALLGFSPGGVSPIGCGDIPVLLDEQLLEYPTVLVAAGEVAVELEIDPARLAEVTGSRTVAVAVRCGTGAEAGRA